jgi:hypothetical protein
VTFPTVVGVFQRMREGGIIEFLLWVEFVKFVGCIGVGVEEGTEEIEGFTRSERVGGNVLLSGSQVGEWGFLTRSSRPFILWRGLFL